MARRKSRKLPYIPPDEELRRIIDASRTERDRLVLLLMYLMGLRVSEVTKLEVRHLDFKKRLLFISQGKGAKDAYLPMTAHLHGPLRGWCHGRKSGYVFPSPLGGGRLSTRALQLMVKRCAVRAGLADALEERRFHPHNFRHGCATAMMKRRVPLPIIQKVLRHSNLATTSIYIDLFPEDLRAAMDG